MESFSPQISPSSNRFFGLFTQPEAPDPASGSFHDFEEEEIFSTEVHSSELNRPQIYPSNPRPRPSLSPSAPLRFHEQNLGILVALPEEDNKHQLPDRSLCRSYSSSARMIPGISKPKAVCLLSLKGGKIYHQSAPMNVPAMAHRAGRGSAKLDGDIWGQPEVDEEEMLPPHEIVASSTSKQSPITTFSVLEGVGRTLKGRDLRRVRNAVWRQTGFQD